MNHPRRCHRQQHTQTNKQNGRDVPFVVFAFMGNEIVPRKTRTRVCAVGAHVLRKIRRNTSDESAKLNIVVRARGTLVWGVRGRWLCGRELFTKRIACVCKRLAKLVLRKMKVMRVLTVEDDNDGADENGDDADDNNDCDDDDDELDGGLCNACAFIYEQNITNMNMKQHSYYACTAGIAADAGTFAAQ